MGTNALVRFPHVDIDDLNKVSEINVTGTLRGAQTPAAYVYSDWGIRCTSSSPAGSRPT